MMYRELRSTFGLKSQMAQSVLKTVIAKYKTNQTNGHERCQIAFKNRKSTSCLTEITASPKAYFLSTH